LDPSGSGAPWFPTSRAARLRRQSGLAAVRESGFQRRSRGRSRQDPYDSAGGTMTREIRILVAAFAASFLATGLPYWPIPYAQVGLPGDIWGWGLVVVAAIAFMCRAFLG